MQTTSSAMIDDVDPSAKAAAQLAQLLVEIQKLEKSDGQAITHVSFSGNTLTFTHADTSKHAIQLPKPQSGPSPQIPKITNDIAYLEQQMAQTGTDVNAIKRQQGELSHRIDAIQSTYTYRGASAPPYPDDPKHSYFINSYNVPAREMFLPLPDLNLPDGTMYLFNNENTTCKVTLQPVTGESIENATSLVVPAQSLVMLVKDGKNWVKSYAGYLPSSLQDLINRVANQLTPELHTDDQITAMINQWFSNPTTLSKLDGALKKLGYEKKTNPQPHPSAIQVYIGTSDTYPTAFTRANGPFAPHQKLVAQGMDATPSKVWIAVPESSADKVTGIVGNGGLPAIWDHKVVTIDGHQWRIYLSPYQFHSQHIDFTLNWSI